MKQPMYGAPASNFQRAPEASDDELTYTRISQMASQIWYTAVGSILGEAGFARFSRDDVRNTLWVRAFRMPYVSVSTPP